MTNTIKIILSILFIVCLLKMPYSYYVFVRTMALVGFVLLAYISYTRNEIKSVVAYIFLAILFQPIYKIALGRVLWNIIDVILAIILITTVLMDKKQEK
ncbi:MAG: hypothetical protein IPK03_05530 [Bacteroidetes bacterium]|nr:hypothetical protein [Bacteroidota bacterium]